MAVGDMVHVRSLRARRLRGQRRALSWKSKIEVQCVEKVGVVPQVVYEGSIVEVPTVEACKFIKQVPKPETQYIDKRVVHETVQYVEKIVEVPQGQYVEKIVEVPQVVYEEQFIEVPTVETREVIKQAPKHEIQHIDDKTYLDQHNILDLMRDILASLIEEKPEDPYSFVGKQFTAHGETSIKDAATSDVVYSEADVENIITVTAKRAVTAFEARTQASFRKHEETVLQLKSNIQGLLGRNEFLEAALSDLDIQLPEWAEKEQWNVEAALSSLDIQLPPIDEGDQWNESEDEEAMEELA